MPIVTTTEDNKTVYYSITEANENCVDSLVTEYKLSEGDNREYAEYALRKEYLRRLTEHAYDCAQLAHFVLNPLDDEDPLHGLKLTERLAAKTAKDAVWLRTYDPFTGLIAEAVNGKDHGSEYGTGLLLDGECVSSLDDDSWAGTDHALWLSNPWRRDHFARMEQEKADKEAALQFTPAGQKRVTKAIDAVTEAFGYAKKLKKRSEKTVANKTVRRGKRTKRAA